MCDGDVCERKPVGPKVVHAGTAAIDASTVAAAAAAPSAAAAAAATATEDGGSDEGGSSEMDDSAAADTAPEGDELPGDLAEEAGEGEGEGEGDGVVTEQEEDPGVAQLVNNELSFSHAAIALWYPGRIANEA